METTCEMLERIQEFSEPIKRTLSKSEKTQYLFDEEEEEEFNFLLDLLEPFKLATTILCGEKYVNGLVSVTLMMKIKKKLNNMMTYQKNNKKLLKEF